MKKKEIINQIAKDLDLEPTQISYIYNQYWLFIRDTIKTETSDIDNNENTNKNISFNLPSFGKLYYKHKKKKI